MNPLDESLVRMACEIKELRGELLRAHTVIAERCTTVEYDGEEYPSRNGRCACPFCERPTYDVAP